RVAGRLGRRPASRPRHLGARPNRRRAHAHQGVRGLNDMAENEASRLTAAHVLEYPYRRSVGPVLGAFFTALSERRLVGVRTRDGRVLVPPVEYDPESGESIDEIVPVGPGGVVTTW